jgi:hypothetical protein
VKYTDPDGRDSKEAFLIFVSGSVNVQVSGYPSVSINKSSDRNISIKIGSDVSKGATLTLQPGASITISSDTDSGSLSVANKRDTPVSLDMGHLLDSFGKYQDTLKGKANDVLARIQANAETGVEALKDVRSTFLVGIWGWAGYGDLAQIIGEGLGPLMESGTVLIDAIKTAGDLKKKYGQIVNELTTDISIELR